jgi:hypothetical protein
MRANDLLRLETATLADDRIGLAARKQRASANGDQAPVRVLWPLALDWRRACSPSPSASDVHSHGSAACAAMTT